MLPCCPQSYGTWTGSAWPPRAIASWSASWRRSVRGLMDRILERPCCPRAAKFPLVETESTHSVGIGACEGASTQPEGIYPKPTLRFLIWKSDIACAIPGAVTGPYLDLQLSRCFFFSLSLSLHTHIHTYIHTYIHT